MIGSVNRFIAHSPGTVWWITGLSNAGKSTVASHLAHILRTRGIHPIVLDGNELREAFGNGHGFDQASRRALAFMYGRLCRLLSSQGHSVICATIALYHDIHEWNRANIQDYFEVFLDVPVPELMNRDTRGIYGTCGVVGIDMPAEFPRSPDLVIANYGPRTASDTAATIYEQHMKVKVKYDS